MCVNVVLMSDGNERMAFVTSGFIIGEFCSSLDDEHKASSGPRAGPAEGCILREHKDLLVESLGHRRRC